MPDHGSIATLGNKTGANNGLTVPQYLRKISIEHIDYPIGGKSTTEGDPSAPSLRVNGQGMWRFRWIVQAGARTVSIKVKQAVNTSPRPTLVVKANTSIGVNSDVTATAGAGTGWVTIGPAAINPSSAGAVWVEMRANYDGTAESFWDTPTVT